MSSVTDDIRFFFQNDKRYHKPHVYALCILIIGVVPFSSFYSFFLASFKFPCEWREPFYILTCVYFKIIPTSDERKR